MCHGVCQCVAVCCTLLRCVAVCCSVLQCVAVCFITNTRHERLRHMLSVQRGVRGVAVCHSELQCISSHVLEMVDWVIDLASIAALPVL